MGDHRGVIVAATAVPVAAAGTLLAAVKASSWMSGLLIAVLVLGLLGMLAVLVSYGVGWFRTWRTRSSAAIEPRGPQPTRPFTSLWRYSTDGMEAVSASNAVQKRVNHPGYLRDPFGPGPSRVVLAVLVPSGPPVEMPTTSDIVRFLLSLLGGTVVAQLTSMAGRVDDNLAWYWYGGNGPLNNFAILARSAEDAEAPAATAILNLIDQTPKVQGFQDPRRAELIITVEHRSDSALTLAELHAWLSQALELPEAFATFLADDVHIPTYDDPAAQVGVLLEGRSDLSALIDAGDVTSPPGIGRSSSFPVYFLADPHGRVPDLAAIAAARGCCDYGPHVHGYEAQLEQLRNKQCATQEG